VRDDYIVCPKCRKGLRTVCSSCDRPLERSWKICPYCATDVVSSAPSQVTEIARG